MKTESTETATDLEAAFAGGFDDERTTLVETPAPAVQTAAPDTGPEVVAETPAEPAAQEATDELAGLPPQVRAMLAEFETLKQTASIVPELQKRLRSAEGRLGDLNSRVSAPAAPAQQQRLEKVEKVREELPEVIEAMEQMFQSREATRQAETPKPEQPDVPASILEQEAPDWESKIVSTEFQVWLQSQDPAYRDKVQRTQSEAVMLAAITKFDVQQSAAAAQTAAAARVTQTRQNRAAAAVTPQGSGRREPSTITLEDAFAAGFSSQR